MKNDPVHQRVTIPKIDNHGDLGRLFFVAVFLVACTAAILIAGPSFRSFFALAVPAGLAVAAIMQLARQYFSGDGVNLPFVMVFVAGLTAAIAVGGPSIKLFFALAVPSGVAVAAIVHLAGRWFPQLKMPNIYLSGEGINLFFVLVFVAGFMAAIWVGGPTIKLFFGFAVTAGLTVAAIMHLARQ
jgi:hypothetical protein